MPFLSPNQQCQSTEGTKYFLQNCGKNPVLMHPEHTVGNATKTERKYQEKHSWLHFLAREFVQFTSFDKNLQSNNAKIKMSQLECKIRILGVQTTNMLQKMT